jgi:HlyD family secretion protein
VRVILTDAGEKLDALRRQDATPDEIRRETQAQLDRTRSAVATVLSAEQRERYVRFAAAQEGAASQTGQAYILDEEGRPQAVDLVLGISDGTFTEVLSGELSSGQPVIIGVDLSASKTSGRPAKRFAF